MEEKVKQPLFTNKQLAALIIPIIIEQTLAVTVGMADTIMVAGAGEEAVSGISLVNQMNMLLIQVFSAMAAGWNRGCQPVFRQTGLPAGQKHRHSAFMVCICHFVHAGRCDVYTQRTDFAADLRTH